MVVHGNEVDANGSHRNVSRDEKCTHEHLPDPLLTWKRHQETNQLSENEANKATRTCTEYKGHRVPKYPLVSMEEETFGCFVDLRLKL